MYPCLICFSLDFHSYLDNFFLEFRDTLSVWFLFCNFLRSSNFLSRILLSIYSLFFKPFHRVHIYTRNSNHRNHLRGIAHMKQKQALCLSPEPNRLSPPFSFILLLSESLFTEYQRIMKGCRRDYEEVVNFMLSQNRLINRIACIS